MTPARVFHDFTAVLVRLSHIRVLGTLRGLELFLGTDDTHPTPAQTGLPFHFFMLVVV